MAAEGLPVQLACRLLSVAESGYYEWRSRPPSARAVRHAWLTEQIRAVHSASRGTYGARRVHAELTLGLGLQVGHNQVELLMARAAIKGLPGTRRPRPRHETPTAADLVERMFTREAPNRLWVTDITEHRTYEGKVYCAVVLDTFSRRRENAELRRANSILKTASAFFAAGLCATRRRVYREVVRDRLCWAVAAA